MTRRPAPSDRYEGFHYEPEPDDDWRLVTGKRCRAEAGYHHPACGRPSVAELLRNAGQPYWAYCELHLYGRWVEEDGVVMTWVLRPDVAGTAQPLLPADHYLNAPASPRCATCGGRYAPSEAAAGFTTCERCPRSEVPDA